MQRITLTQAQKTRLTEALSDIRNINGIFDIMVEASDTLTVVAKGMVICRGYVEEDTGSYIETERRADVTLSGWVRDPQTDDDTDVIIDDGGTAYDYLNAS